MYSLVLMMASTAAPEAAACHKEEYGCTGCYGAPAPVTYTSCSGCSGSAGCHGSLLFGGFSCTGTMHYVGCCGGGHGGLFKHHSCTGYSCTGYSCTGYSSGCYGAPPVYSAPIAPAPKTIETVPAPKSMPAPPKATSLPATITVNVPADAKILIDGAPTTSTSAVRHFTTPTLEGGAVYYYTITAEVVRSGKTFTAVEKVAVEAGANPTISLDPTAEPTVARK